MEPDEPAMIGLPPSARGLTGRSKAIAEHASQVAREWEDVGERYVRRRMKALGVPDNQIGQPDYGGDGRLRVFDPYEVQGGANTTGVVVDSGVLNPELLQGERGQRIWPKTRLRDRIDAIIGHEYEELSAGGNHAKAVKATATTKLPISDEARRLNRARAR